MGFLQTSLDSKQQFSSWSASQTSSGWSWDKKQKRAFHCGLSGLKRCWYQKKMAFFLTLTSSPKSSHLDLRHHWDLLVQRIRKVLKFKFEYLKVETYEGYGVIHCLFHSAFEGWRYKNIHEWFSKVWFELHGARIVWCTVVGSSFSGRSYSMRKCAAYLCQYMGGQRGFFRRSTSKGWIFPKYRSVFLSLVNRLGFKFGLQAWEKLLVDGVDRRVFVQFPIGF